MRMIVARVEKRWTVTLETDMEGKEGSLDTVFAEYCSEGTIAPLCMIRRETWRLGMTRTVTMGAEMEGDGDDDDIPRVEPKESSS